MGVESKCRDLRAKYAEIEAEVNETFNPSVESRAQIATGAPGAEAAESNEKYEAKLKSIRKNTGEHVETVVDFMVGSNTAQAAKEAMLAELTETPEALRKLPDAVVEDAKNPVNAAVHLSPLGLGAIGKLTKEIKAAKQASQAAKEGKIVAKEIGSAEKAVEAARAGRTSGSVVKETGSYTNIHESGKTYSGKGSRERSQVSARRIENETGDRHIATEWIRAPNERDAFKQEAKRIEAAGGPRSPKNYNKAESTGKKLLEEEEDR